MLLDLLRSSGQADFRKPVGAKRKSRSRGRPGFLGKFCPFAQENHKNSQDFQGTDRGLKIDNFVVNYQSMAGIAKALKISLDELIKGLK